MYQYIHATFIRCLFTLMTKATQKSFDGKTGQDYLEAHRAQLYN